MRVAVPWETIVLFQAREIRQAIAHALDGGVALHVWTPDPGQDWTHAPQVFRKNMSQWAHLFDQDRARLERTVRSFGVKQVFVHHAGTRRQHADMCATPLARAVARSLRLR